MTIERLRSLEKEWRKESDDFERDGDEGTASAYYNCAEQLSAILADLGQEAAPVACRGYAKLGIGAYLIEHSAESEPAALMLCIASDEEKAGRTVGDLKTFEGERQPIPAEKMTVRIDFANVAGLDALEQQLRILREVHFPASPAHTSDARDAVLKGVRELVIKAAAYWDADEDMKVGKILMALAGQLPKYDKRADAFDAALEASR